MRAKQFFYTAAGMLLLVIAYSVGAHRVDAQTGSQFAGISVYDMRSTVAITSNGDVYARNRVPRGNCGSQMAWLDDSPCFPQEPDTGWQFMGNVLGGTIATTAATMSGVKQKYGK